jgi:hypothetical protein
LQISRQKSLPHVPEADSQSQHCEPFVRSGFCGLARWPYKGDHGDKGDRGPTGSAGPAGQNAFGTFGPVHFTNRDDTGCGGAEVWAHDTEDRFYTVDASQDGSGYTVTRYDVHGTFTTVPGTHHPGDCPNTFDSADAGTFNGVWTRSISGNFDYNPDATIPASGTWGDFIAAFFAPNGEIPTVTDKSYEFDYYNTCGDHGATRRIRSRRSSTADRSETALGNPPRTGRGRVALPPARCPVLPDAD